MNLDDLKNLKQLIETISILRSPQGCPWDREQTHKSLRENLLQETYEALDAIDKENDDNLKEELGDVLLQVVLHSQIASEENKYTIEDVAKGITDKLIRRHPHVFSDIKVKDSDEVMVNWEKIKRKEKPERNSALSGIAETMPALMVAQELSKKAVKTGFEWPDESSLWDCFESEIKEFKDEIVENNQKLMEEEFGDILFSLVNVARWHKIDPEIALINANKKFKARFQLMETLASKDLAEYNIDELEEFWQKAKEELKNKK
ncbi:MAG: nucleoside triphosphate pyrophosphohydrolase [bacterium]